MPAPKRTTRLLWFAVIFLVLIGLAAVTRRALVLLWPSTFSGGSANPAAALDTGFARHMRLTFLHILPGGLFLALAPFQFAANWRQKHLQLHRWVGTTLVLCGLIIGTSALVMSFKMNIGGPNETAATTLFAIVFLFCLTKAYLFIRHKNVTRHREWMIRAYGVGLGVATTRPIVGMFFAARRMTRTSSSALPFGSASPSRSSPPRPGSTTRGITRCPPRKISTEIKLEFVTHNLY